MLCTFFVYALLRTRSVAPLAGVFLRGMSCRFAREPFSPFVAAGRIWFLKAANALWRPGP